ncbi:hypothetical protein ACFQ61_06885 [Streptomyces sp. NPDC056500]|uniref:hypothetical protein n=1 Tax=Streptomyces sp. NPDC056500 TaxID=3345840 RepID=UPI0036BE03B6
MEPSQSQIEPVRRVDATLRSLGAAGDEWTERAEGEAWFADWAGDLDGIELYIGLMGHGRHPDVIRVLFDDWVFDHVVVEHLEAVVTAVFSGRARLSNARWLFFFHHQVLEIPAGGTSYSAGRAVQDRDRLSRWERNIFADEPRRTKTNEGE